MPHLLLPALAGLLLVPSVHAASTVQTHRAIVAAYRALDAAESRRDLRDVLKHFLPDAVSIDPKGRVGSLAQSRQALGRLFALAHTIQAGSAVQKVSPAGRNQATATVREHMTLLAVSPQTHTPVRITIDDRTRDLWIKTAQGWRLKRSQELSQRATINGRPVRSF